MKKKILQTLALVALLAVATATALTQPAAATPYRVTVQMPDGTLQQLIVDLPDGVDLEDLPALQVEIPGVPLALEPLSETGPGPTTEPPAPQPQPEPQAPEAPQAPALPPAAELEPTEKGDTIVVPNRPRRKLVRDERRQKNRKRFDTQPKKKKDKAKVEDKTGGTTPDAPLRNADGSPTPRNPGFFDALPGPSVTTGVPNFVIRKFRVPIFLLPIYQAAGIQYGIRWEILAAINEIETDYGRNLNVSSAGALGWMQFMPSTWEAYGTDANRDGRRDPYNPVDAIFAAARYLKAAGYEEDVRTAIFAYNHADWYVDSVMLRARLIAGVPSDLVGSLTGLTEGRFPVAARARYADDLAERDLMKKVHEGENAANVIESDDSRRGIEIYAQQGAPAVAVQDGVIKRVAKNKRLGRHVILQDTYGNRYTYAHLGEIAKYHPVPKSDALAGRRAARAMRANDPKPDEAASAGRQAPAREAEAHGKAQGRQATAPVKQRLFANPEHPLARDYGGLDQAFEHAARKDDRFETFENYFSRAIRLDADKFSLRRMKRGSHVIGGTILGRVGSTVAGKGSHLYFAIRPAGKGAPLVDPKPILDGWKLLEATAIYRAEGRNVLSGDGASIGQIMMMPKPLLERRVLKDERIDIYDCGRTDIRSGQIDRRVLATMAYLAESGFRPTITSLTCGHGYLTASGNVSHHSSGNAMDIAAINGIPIYGNQDPGGITEQTVRQIMRLQGTMQPDQIISLFEIGGNTFAMGDHDDHIHVGFSPRFGANRKLGRQALMVLKPGQWTDLLDRLGEIDNPAVPTRPSEAALPTRRGEGDVPRISSPVLPVAVTSRDHGHDEVDTDRRAKKQKQDKGKDKRKKRDKPDDDGADKNGRKPAGVAVEQARAELAERRTNARRQMLRRIRAAERLKRAARRRIRREAERDEPTYPALFPLPPIG